MSRAYKKLTGVKVGDIKEEQKGEQAMEKNNSETQKRKK